MQCACKIKDESRQCLNSPKHGSLFCGVHQKAQMAQVKEEKKAESEEKKTYELLISCTKFGPTNNLIEHTDTIFRELAKILRGKTVNITVINPRDETHDKMSMPASRVLHVEKTAQKYGIKAHITGGILAKFINHIKINPMKYDFIIFAGCNMMTWLFGNSANIENLSQYILPTTRIFFMEMHNRAYNYISNIDWNPSLRTDKLNQELITTFNKLFKLHEHPLPHFTLM